MSEPTEEDKRNTETLDDEIHLLCFLTGPPENYNTDQIQEIDNIKHITDLKGLPMVVVATKFDEQCLNVMEDVDHLYKCKKSKETTEDIAIFFKIQENHVLPVVNYTSENVKSKGKDILALQALYKMIEVTEDFLAKHPDRQRPIQATQEVDDRRAPEEVMEDVEEQGNNDVQTSVDGHQTSEPSLSDRLNSKSYRPPKDTCIFDGRLIKLGLKDIADLEKNCIKPIGDGAFGKVFTSNSVSDGFGMHVAVKKIPFDKPDAHSRSIRREMITSRIMHPFILPLLAVVDLTNRDIVLHKDISSKNVVLDDAYNARLIDFGLAREKDDQTTDARGRMCYSPPDIGRGKPATESWDYYMFAVIIREILTGLGPQGINNKFLKNMEAEEVLQKLEKRVWIETDRARYLNDIAEQCLQQNARTVSEFNTTVVERINAIWTKYFWGSKIHQVPNNYAKCHICMINPKARETSMTQKHAANCRQKIEVCIACEKNSSLNPITCYCGTKLTPLIGSRCGALLVAGNDTNNKSMAKALAKDIEELKKLITSQAPRIMGISEDKVRTVIPSIPDKPDNPKLEEEQELWPKVKEHIRYFSNETEIDTLLIYFSCHDASNMGTGDAKNHNVFRFGSASDNITLDQFEDELESLENIDKLIIFLDRCFPPLVRFKKRDRKFIQINACKQDEMADITDSGSVFTKYLIQGLKAKSERKKCSDSNCQHCDAYWSNSSGSDFISVSSLFDYVKKHMEAIQGPLPVPTMQIDFQNIAFYTDEEVIIEFTCEEEQKRVPLEYLQNMELLQDTLYEVFKRDKSTTRVRIQRDTYRKDDRFVNCETLKTVMSAWIHRQPLTVTFETSPS
ncbi:uncharacterized protein LOC128554016 isoform X2 [Mercenaria mercenaria]|uniref:uncharacterized protein LOC128554016 isoform X2 n=1 Tax=Mercenaria mercenaria TaxID=6596 RepID=UPI00234F42BA|nr:uncharacterized protein LOC128554016 isoform X2 [Mercenaria mercenaria]